MVACAIATEVEDTDEVVRLAAAGEGKLYNGIPKEDLPPLTLQGIRSMDLWDNANNDAIRQNNKLLKRLSAPWKTKMSKNCCKYHRIPWFKLGFLGKKHKNKSRGGCQSLCNKYIGCKSFSYNFDKKMCIWSPQAVTYDQDWRFYSKKTNLQGKPDGTYHMFPGMKYLEPTSNIEKDVSLQQCMYSCTKELGCNAFSYSEPRTECARSGSAIGYSEHRQYFEKDQSGTKKPTWVEKHEKENEIKDKLKKDYVNDIDRLRTKQKKQQAKERKNKVDIEVTVKKDSKLSERGEKALEHEAAKGERKKKTADKSKESEEKFKSDMSSTTAKIDQIEKTGLEIVQKRLVQEKDSAAKAQLMSKKKAIQGKLDKLKDKYNKEHQKEKAEKADFRAKDEKKNQAEEVKQKDEQKEADERSKQQMAEEEAKMLAEEKKNKDCKVVLKDAKVRLAEAKRTEKQSKTKMATEETMVARWVQKTKMATNENHKKQYDEFVKESKESLNKATADEQTNVKNEMTQQRKENKVKEKCKKKKKKKKKKSGKKKKKKKKKKS